MSSMSNSNWRYKTGRMKLHAFNTLHYDVICKTSFLLEACVISKFPPSLTAEGSTELSPALRAMAGTACGRGGEGCNGIWVLNQK